MLLIDISGSQDGSLNHVMACEISPLTKKNFFKCKCNNKLPSFSDPNWLERQFISNTLSATNKITLTSSFTACAEEGTKDSDLKIWEK